jgi:diadenosine tetraphosphate (Ap4A) HIT family hydrolase
VPCPFCQRLTDGPLVAQNALAAAFLDGYPLNDGHCLIVPRRHEPDFFGLTAEEQAAVWALANEVRRNLQTTRTPDGYNLGLNIGDAAGQTVAHAHVHLIPRYLGDVADPRGGVRWIIPERAPYWKTR